MKKKYVKPEISIIPLDMEELLAPIISSTIKQGEVDDDEGQMSKGDTFEDDWGNPFSDSPFEEGF
ncbi:hypothetical protein E5358_13840 [Palleniella muris]|uniref:Uncharacterized protein n=1 Tax=Palleniella muris TaxID=3038145 RepID=A0AC61QLZ5_9BACT|nr:hypothetical protein [Palleniella muris]TGX80022.1 hypothetical protein E5358_13840 [Palleniella muris]